MPFDAHRNLGVASVVTAPSPATSGVTLVVGAGQGARFPAVPFNVTIWPIDMAPDPSTAEVARVTARTTDTLTLVRAQEGTTARAIVAGDFIAATITAKSLTDIESGTNFPLITTPGDLTTAGQLLGPSTGNFVIRPSTNDGADGAQTVICGGGGTVDTRGAAISVLGNEVAGAAGDIYFVAGAPTGKIHFFASGDRGTIHPSGGFSWGGTSDPGAGIFLVGGAPAAGSTYTQISPGGSSYGYAGTAGFFYAIFNNSNGVIGSISGTGSATAYSTTSDQRLKTSLSRHTDPSVLRDTVIHNFVWKADGQPGRGVFAQEAHTVAPFAVSVGTDERDDEGRLSHPWGVDYSKYVPDLITGWQHHEVGIEILAARVAQLEAAAMSQSRQSWVGQLYQRIREASVSLGRLVTQAWITP